MSIFSVPVQPDWPGLLQCLRRQGRSAALPRRVHVIELFLDAEVKDAITARFGLARDLDRAAPDWAWRREIELQRFLGYDYVRCGVDAFAMPFHHGTASDTADMTRPAGRSFVDEQRGPITTWEEFERYPWPDPATFTTRALEFYERNLPDDMCVIGSGGFAHFAEHLTWLLGYETLCYALFEQRNLLQSIVAKLLEQNRAMLRAMLQFSRVKIIWGADDMGFRSGTLVSPEDLRVLVLPGHQEMAAGAHAAGRPYVLHSCGLIDAIMEDLIDVVKIDAKHSFEDTIETVEAFQDRYGGRVAVLGGIDVDFLCRADEAQVRQRVRKTLAHCLPRGGYCLGTGNSVANYIPLDNYLAMLDEGRRFLA
jgi:uroporphyrinogen decarboxylase